MFPACDFHEFPILKKENKDCFLKIILIRWGDKEVKEQRIWNTPYRREEKKKKKAQQLSIVGQSLCMSNKEIPLKMATKFLPQDC